MKKPDISIIGKTFGNLRVEELSAERNRCGRPLYRCTCLLCGKERLVTRSNLLNDGVKDCGWHKGQNLIGKRFGKLVVVGFSDNIQKKWRCQCDCGKIIDSSTQKLVEGRSSSCGCAASERIKGLFVGGSEPSKFNSNIWVTNTSGVKGVWWDKSRNLWVAEIMFKRKKYSLGRFANKEDAVLARKNAEEKLWGDFLAELDKQGKKEK